MIKYILTAHLLFMGLCFSQNKAVTKNASSHYLNETLRANSNAQIMIDPSGLILSPEGSIVSGEHPFNNVYAKISSVAEGVGLHGIMGRTVTGLDGIGVIGWSSSGASAVKALQDTYFDSPALTVWRSTKSGTNNWEWGKPALLIAKDDVNYVDPTSPAVIVNNGTYPTFTINWDGSIVVSGIAEFVDAIRIPYISMVNQMVTDTRFDIAVASNILGSRTGLYYVGLNKRVHPVYLGEFSSNPATGSVNTSLVGDTYWNTSDGRMHMLTPSGWKHITNP